MKAKELFGDFAADDAHWRPRNEIFRAEIASAWFEMQARDIEQFRSRAKHLAGDALILVRHIRANRFERNDCSGVGHRCIEAAQILSKQSVGNEERARLP